MKKKMTKFLLFFFIILYNVGAQDVTIPTQTFTVYKVVIKRDIAGGGTDFKEINSTNSNNQVLPGQKITLRVETEPAGAAPSEYKWIISGTIFKNYTASAATGVLTSISNNDLKNHTVEFYWADANDGRQVVVGVKIRDTWYWGKASLDIKKPTCTFATTLGSTKMNGVGSAVGLYAAAGQTWGITYTGKVTVPTGFAEGQWHWVQLVKDGVYRIQSDGTRQEGNHFGDWTLDNTYPYEPDETGSYSTGNTSQTDIDQPSSPLSPNTLRETGTSDEFQMYLMFLPPGEESRYVPLRKITWGWGFKATNNASTGWSIVPNSTTQHVSSSFESYSHPTWSANWDPFSWVTVTP